MAPYSMDLRLAGDRAVGVHCLPPYSPDLNPIELWIAKLTAQLRTARRRTVEEIWHTVAACLALFPPPSAATISAPAAMLPLYDHKNRADCRCVKCLSYLDREGWVPRT